MQLDFKTYGDKTQFLQENETLYRFDKSGLIFLGLLRRLDGARIKPFAVMSGFLPVLAGFVADGSRMSLSHAFGSDSDEIFDFLTDNLIQTKTRFLSVRGEEKSVKSFAGLYAKKTRSAFIPRAEIAVMAAEEIASGNFAKGRARKAEATDLHTLACFLLDMGRELSATIGDYKTRLAEAERELSDFYVWENGEPLACLKIRLDADCAVLTDIYTPPEHRGKGYASALTSAVGGTALKSAPVCLIEADRFNAAAMHVYKKIGFSETARFLDGWFAAR